MKLWRIRPADCEVWLASATVRAVEQLARDRARIESLCLAQCVGRDWSVLSRFKHLRRLAVLPWKHPSFDVLGALTDLRELDLVVYGSASDLRPLGALRRLESLSIHSPATLTCFDALKRLPRLQTLQIYTFSGRVRLDSPTSIAQLNQLRWLLLGAVRFRRGSIRSFARMTNLRELGLPNVFPVQDCAWLAAHMPRTECGLFTAAEETDLKCPKCGGHRTQITGNRAVFVCRRCRPGAVERHVERFEALKRAAVRAAAARRRSRHGQPSAPSRP